jgi:hypothetical protein
LNRRPRLLTASEEGGSLRKSAIARLSSRSLMERDGRAQFADTEAADDLVVVAVLVVRDEFANAGQQR